MTRPEPRTRVWLNLATVAAILGLGALVVRQASLAMRPSAPRGFSAADPLDEAALARLGFEAERRGEDARAAALIGLAGRLSWRDAPAQAWLLQRAAAAGDWTSVADHADALLRTDGRGVLRSQVFRLLDVMAADETSRPALLARLRAAPWWRAAWLTHLTAAAASPDGAVGPDAVRAVLMWLASGSRPPTSAEYLPYIEMRLARGDYGQAEHDWRTLARRPAALLRDPRFEAVGDGGPFDWTQVLGVGASSEVEATDGGRALRVDYDGFSAPRLPGQLLVLPPGRYSLAWRERTVGPPRLVWRVRRAGPTTQILAQAPPLAAPGWRARALTFDVTADCPAQQLELTPLPGERRDEVTGWFTALTLTRRS